MSKKVGRNAPCPCGSGRKAKKCCHAVPTDPGPKPLPPALLATHPGNDHPIDPLLDSYFEAVETGRTQDAEAAARTMLTRFPERIDGHERLAEVFASRHDHLRAMHHYRSAAGGMTPDEPNYDPSYVPYLLYRADVHRRLARGTPATPSEEATDSIAGDLIRGDLDEASFLIELLVAATPDDHLPLERRGQLHEIRGDYAAAAQDFRKAAGLAENNRADPAHVEYLLTRADRLAPFARSP